MIAYLGLNAILFLFLLLRDYFRKLSINISNNKIIEIDSAFLFSFIALGLFMGLRGDFTQDYRNYEQIFLNTMYTSYKDILLFGGYEERGYLIINKIFSEISKSPNIFMFVESFAYVFLNLWVAKRMQKNIIMFTMLFVNAGIYFFAFNMIRQALAASIVFLGIYYLGKEERLKYFLLVLLACTIHSSSIIMLILYPLLIRKINFINSILIILCGGVAWITLKNIIAYVQIYRYSNYSYGMEEGTINAFLVQWVICIFVLLLINIYNINTKNSKYSVLINCLSLYILFSVLTLQVYQMSRLCYFFSSPMLLLASDIIEKLEGRSGYIVKMVISLLLIVYSYVWLQGSGYNPYSTFL